MINALLCPDFVILSLFMYYTPIHQIYISHKQFIKTITDKDNKISYFLLYLISEPYGPAVPMSKVIFDPRNPTCSPYVLWDRIQS